MRTNATLAEQKLWQALRAGRLNGLKIRRQMPIGPFIVDFVIPSEKLVIEVDGSQHDDARGYDESRTKWLQNEGYRVLRFWNSDVLSNLTSVLQTILCSASLSPPTPLSPLAQGRESPSPLKGEGF